MTGRMSYSSDDLHKDCLIEGCPNANVGFARLCKLHWAKIKPDPKVSSIAWNGLPPFGKPTHHAIQVVNEFIMNGVFNSELDDIFGDSPNESPRKNPLEDMAHLLGDLGDIDDMLGDSNRNTDISDML